jgi:hypothetical protein
MGSDSLWRKLKIPRTSCAGLLVGNEIVTCDGPATILGWADLISMLLFDPSISCQMPDLKTTNFSYFHLDRISQVLIQMEN